MTSRIKAFAKFGGVPTNFIWSVSAMAPDHSSLVLSLWPQNVTVRRGGCSYWDDLDAWNGNALGREELRVHLAEAFARKLPIYAVVAIVSQNTLDSIPDDATSLAGTVDDFDAKPDWGIGRLTHWNGSEFEIKWGKE